MAEIPDPPPKTLTPQEANALLPAVTPLVEQLQALQGSILETNQKLDETVTKLAAGNGFPIEAVREELHQLTEHQLQLLEAFKSALNQLQALGGILKDLKIGLVDFYGLRGGELVYLCWKLGEPRIRFWHPLDGGYAARQPLD